MPSRELGGVLLVLGLLAERMRSQFWISLHRLSLLCSIRSWVDEPQRDSVRLGHYWFQEPQASAWRLIC
jgi:hypothetical protein